MSFLNNLLSYNRIVLQCHNNPDADALASALGIYKYLRLHGKEVQIIYGGEEIIKRRNLIMMLKECDIPVCHIKELPPTDLLVTVDCQYGLGNVQKFEACKIAIIDHHIQTVDDDLMYHIRSNYQSCCTIVYEMLLEEGYDVKGDFQLTTAFLFGLYIDTFEYRDLYNSADIKMRADLQSDNPVLDKLIKSNLSVAELYIASDALYNHYMDFKRGFIVVPAINCDQAILGMIADLVVQVDKCNIVILFTKHDYGYSFSIRSCNDIYSSRDLAIALSKDIGSGGGHQRKAGARATLELVEKLYNKKMARIDMTEIIIQRTCDYIDSVNNTIIA